jgi:molecular chaperone GrpE
MSRKKIVMPTAEEIAEYTAARSSGNEAPGNNPAEHAPSGGEPDGSVGTSATAAATQAPPEQPEQPRSEAEEYKDKYLRAVAELANYRKRCEKDREESLRYANVNLVRSLLPVLDYLERVIASAQEHPENTAAIIDGARLTASNFRKVLAEHGVQPIEAQGQPFDPSVHEAMMQQPSDQYSEPTVLQVVQEGYKLHDRVIRPARVVVSAPKPTE